MKDKLKRVSLLIKEDQYQRIADHGINFSGLVRDLIDDYFSEHKITLTVKEETRLLYDKIVANTGCTDGDIEPFFKKSLANLLESKIEIMQNLEKSIKESEKNGEK